MEQLSEIFIWGLFVFIAVFLVNFLWIFKRGYQNIKKQKKKKKNKKLEDFVGLSYLIPKFKLDINKMNLNYVFFIVSLINAFIISFVFMVVTIIPWNVGFSMLLGFVLLFGLIYALYEIYGRILVKKGWSKNES